MFFDQFTPEQMRAQYAKNRDELMAMLEQARAVAPRKYRGYTVAQLEAKVAEFAQRATLTAPTDA